MSIDLNSCDITRLGSQGGVEKGYNPKWHSCGFHHFLIDLVDQFKMVVNAWLRTGVSVFSTNFSALFNELQSIVLCTRICLFRLQVHNHNHHPIFASLIFQCMAIGSYLVKTGRKTIRKFSAKQNPHHPLDEQFLKCQIFNPHFKFSLHNLRLYTSK